MEKLEKLSDDESKVFFTLLSHEDNNKKKNYTEENAIEILNKLKIGLDFDFDKVLYFFNKIMLNEINHLDISERNIMKDSCGTFKLIDFERIKNEDEN
jgi:RIO-like serine/threonine protein kinase